MTSRDRLALFSLIFAGSLCLGPVASAENLSAQSGKIIRFERAGKYAEALPLAQVYGGLGQDSVAEPIYKRALAIMEKAAGIDSVAPSPLDDGMLGADARAHPSMPVRARCW